MKMSDNPKKKNLDSNMLAMSQNHEHCLDKQRVKDAIIKVAFDESGRGDFLMTKDDLEKELGL